MKKTSRIPSQEFMTYRLRWVIIWSYRLEAEGEINVFYPLWYIYSLCCGLNQLQQMRLAIQIKPRVGTLGYCDHTARDKPADYLYVCDYGDL